MNNTPLNLAIAQLDNSINWKKNCAKAKRIITQFSKKNVDIVCFQEAYLSGYHAKIFKKDFSTMPDLIEQIRTHAYKKDICVLLPTIEKRGKNYYSTAYVFNSDKGDKLIYKEGLTQSEKTVMKGRKSNRIITLKGVKLGVLLCREMEDPAFTYLSQKSLPDLILWPSYWGWEYRMKWSKLRLSDGKRDKCFSLINKIKRPLVQINMSRTLNKKMEYLRYGKSVVVNADNEKVGVGKYGAEDLYIVSYKDGKILKRAHK